MKSWLGHDKSISYVVDGWRTIPQLIEALRHPQPYSWPILLAAMALPNLAVAPEQPHRCYRRDPEVGLGIGVDRGFIIADRLLVGTPQRFSGTDSRSNFRRRIFRKPYAAHACIPRS
jgi:hypothetical protein